MMVMMTITIGVKNVRDDGDGDAHNIDGNASDEDENDKNGNDDVDQGSLQKVLLNTYLRPR